MKKQAGAVCFALIVLVCWLLGIPTSHSNAPALPEVLVPVADQPAQAPIQPLKDLVTAYGETAPEDPWIWKPQDELTLVDHEVLDAWVREAGNRPDLCEAQQSQRRRFPLSGHHKTGYYAFKGSYPEYIHVVHVLLSIADSELRNDHAEGLAYLGAAAQIATLLCDTAGQRESVAANQIFVLLGRYVLQDMPKKWLTHDVLCWFPDDKACRTLAASISWDILQSAAGLLENRKQVYSVYDLSNKSIRLDYLLSNTSWQMRPNMTPLVNANTWCQTAISGPFWAPVDWSQYHFGFWDFFRLDYVEHMIALDCIERVHTQLLALTRLKAIRDRIELEAALRERGEDGSPEQVQLLVRELGLTNIFTGEHYQVTNHGDLILFPNNIRDVGLSHYKVTVPGVVDYGE